MAFVSTAMYARDVGCSAPDVEITLMAPSLPDCVTVAAPSMEYVTVNVVCVGEMAMPVCAAVEVKGEKMAIQPTSPPPYGMKGYIYHHKYRCVNPNYVNRWQLYNYGSIKHKRHSKNW